MSTIHMTVATYISKGWSVVPLPPKEKGPKLKGWPSLSISVEDIPDYFEANANIGVMLGDNSKGLIDIDLDCPEAVALAPQFLPQTKALLDQKSFTRSLQEEWLLECLQTSAFHSYTKLPSTIHKSVRS